MTGIVISLIVCFVVVFLFRFFDVVFLFSFFDVFDESDSLFERIISSAFISVFATYFFFALQVMSLCVYDHYALKTEKSYQVSIYSLKDSSQIYGRFTVGTGTIKTTDYYHYYRKNSNGSFRREQVPVLQTYIFATDIVKPNLLVTYKSTNNKFNKYFSGDTESIDSESYRYILFVPKDTVVQTFQVR